MHVLQRRVPFLKIDLNTYFRHFLIYLLNIHGMDMHYKLFYYTCIDKRLGRLHASPVRLTSLINILRHVYFRTDASISKVLDLKLPINGYVYLKSIDKTKLSKIAEQFLCLVNLVESGIHFFQMIAWFSYVY